MNSEKFMIGADERGDVRVFLVSDEQHLTTVRAGNETWQKWLAFLDQGGIKAGHMVPFTVSRCDLGRK